MRGNGGGASPGRTLPAAIVAVLLIAALAALPLSAPLAAFSPWLAAKAQLPTPVIHSIAGVTGSQWTHATQSDREWTLFYNPNHDSSFRIDVDAGTGAGLRLEGPAAFGDHPIDTTPSSPPATFSIEYTIETGAAENGTLTLFLFNTGNTSFSTVSFRVIPDGSPPSGCRVSAPAAVVESGYTVHLDTTSVKEISGIGACYLDDVTSGGSPTTARASMSVPYIPGTHRYAGYAVDLVGNVGPLVNATTIASPRPPPAIQLVSVTSDSASNPTMLSNDTLFYRPGGAFNLTFIFRVLNSGNDTSIESTQVGSQSILVQGPFNDTEAVRVGLAVPASSPGPFSGPVVFTITSGAGTGTLSVNLTPDSSPPSFDLVVSSSAGGDMLLATVTAANLTDGSGSGIASVCLDVIDATRSEPVTVRNTMVFELKQGRNLVGGWATDNLGNKGPLVTREIMLDSEGPDLSVWNLSLSVPATSASNIIGWGAPGISLTSLLQGNSFISVNTTALAAFLGDGVKEIVLNGTVNVSDPLSGVSLVDAGGGLFTTAQVFREGSGSAGTGTLSLDFSVKLNRDTLAAASGAVGNINVLAVDKSGHTSNVSIAVVADGTGPSNASVEMVQAGSESMLTVYPGSDSSGSTFAIVVLSSPRLPSTYAEWTVLSVERTWMDASAALAGFQHVVTAGATYYTAMVVDACGNAGRASNTAYLASADSTDSGGSLLSFIFIASAVVLVAGVLGYLVMRKKGFPGRKDRPIMFSPTGLGLRPKNVQASSQMGSGTDPPGLPDQNQDQSSRGTANSLYFAPERPGGEHSAFLAERKTDNRVMGRPDGAYSEPLVRAVGGFNMDPENATSPDKVQIEVSARSPQSHQSLPSLQSAPPARQMQPARPQSNREEPPAPPPDEPVPGAPMPAGDSDASASMGNVEPSATPMTDALLRARRNQRDAAYKDYSRKLYVDRYTYSPGADQVTQGMYDHPPRPLVPVPETPPLVVRSQSVSHRPLLKPSYDDRAAAAPAIPPGSNSEKQSVDVQFGATPRPPSLQVVQSPNSAQSRQAQPPRPRPISGVGNHGQADVQQPPLPPPPDSM